MIKLLLSLIINEKLKIFEMSLVCCKKQFEIELIIAFLKTS